jgi:nucleoside-diphosphate-sugar epimerase
MVEPSLIGRRVLVTGATGFLGSHLVRALAKNGAEVHALKRQPGPVSMLSDVQILWHVGDVTHPDSLVEVVRAARPEIVFHLAAYGTTFEQNDERLAFRINVEGSLNLWRALSDRPCRFVHTGSCGEYGQAREPVTEDHVCRPTWFYPATKNASVVLLSTLGRMSDRELVTLRPFGPYGPGDKDGRVIPHTVQTLLRGEEVRVTAGEQLRDYAYVDDQVAAFVRAATQPLKQSGNVYNIGSGRVVSMRHILETVARAVGDGALTRVHFGAVPYRKDELWSMCGRIDAVQRDLGYAPTVSLEEGIRRTVEWYRRRGTR